MSTDKKEFKIKYQKCEHVNFNQGLAQQNLKLYILPNLINRGYEELTFPPLAATRLIMKNWSKKFAKSFTWKKLTEEIIDFINKFLVMGKIIVIDLWNYKL